MIHNSNERENIQVNTVKPDLNFNENDISYRVLNIDYESKLDKKIDVINEHIKNNDGYNKPENEKDMLYATAQIFWKEYQMELRGAKFNFYMNRPQYNLLTDILLKRLEYTVDTVFLAIELSDLLGFMKESKFISDKDLNKYEVTATEITYIYHLIAPYKIKGLTKEAFIFADILKRIGIISRVIAYYDATAKSLNKDITDWVSSFENLRPEPLTIPTMVSDKGDIPSQDIQYEYDEKTNDIKKKNVKGDKKVKMETKIR